MAVKRLACALAAAVCVGVGAVWAAQDRMDDRRPVASTSSPAAPQHPLADGPGAHLEGRAWA
jgi:hypothetical protein